MKSSVSSAARIWMLASVLGALIIAFVFFHRQINRAWSVHLFLNSNNPREEFFDELAKQSDDPVNFLQRCWATGKIPDRQFVAAFLKDSAAANSSWLSRAEPLVLACTIDADSSVREMGFAALEAARNPKMFDAAQAQLDDLDPLVRLLGLDYVRKCDPKLAVPVLVRLLDDSDLRVVTGAEMGLKHWSGEDFGVRMYLAVPTPEDPQSEKIKTETIRRGVDLRKEWWRIHQKDYRPSAGLVAQFAKFESAQVSRPPAPDFTLRDLEGKSVSLSDFRGKVVLLNFWATWCTACLAEIPDLVNLQKKSGNQIVIIGVALDGVVDEHGEIPGGDEKSDNGTSLKDVRAKVERAVKLRRINYRILLDPKNSVGGQYNGGELPTTIIFDKDGKVRRRFVGERGLAVFEAMIAEAGRPMDSRRELKP